LPVYIKFPADTRVWCPQLRSRRVSYTITWTSSSLGRQDKTNSI